MANRDTQAAGPSSAAPPSQQRNAIYGELMQLARRSGSRHGFLNQALVRTTVEFGSPYGLLYARMGGEVVQEEARQGPGAPTFWRGAVQQFMSDALATGRPRAKLLSARGAELRIALLFAPIRDEAAGLDGGLAFVVRAGPDDARSSLQRLDSIASIITAAVTLVGNETAARERGNLPGEALGRAASAGSLEELAYAITNGLRNRLACEQVALGLVRGSNIRIVSISGLDDVNRRSPGVSRMLAAMEECLDACVPVVCQRERDWGGTPKRWQLHEQWRAETGGDAVVSIPLRAGENWAAVLSLRRRDDDTLRSEQVDEIRKLVEPFAPALHMVRQANRGLATHAVDALRTALTVAFGRGRLGQKLLIGLVAAAAAWFSFGTLDYDLHLSASVAPASSRQQSAPFEGVLAAVHVVPGDAVHAGDILCELDRRDLELERDRLVAQIDVIEKERTRALADKNPVEARLAEANLRLAQTQRAIVERRLEQSLIRAPFDGIVVRGDLRKQIGDVLPLGMPLFEVAPLQGWLLQISAPESVVADVAAGQDGEFSGAGRPEDALSFTVGRVAPSTEVRQGRNVYMVEAQLGRRADWLRPGIEGSARVHIGPRRVWWLVCHHALDALRLNFWL